MIVICMTRATPNLRMIAGLSHPVYIAAAGTVYGKVLL